MAQGDWSRANTTRSCGLRNYVARGGSTCADMKRLGGYANPPLPFS